MATLVNIMEQIETDKGIIDLSFKARQEYREDLQKKRKITGSRLDEEINEWMIDHLNTSILYLVRHGFPIPKKTRVLMAHGNSFDGLYRFAETDSKGRRGIYDVQDWVNAYDGKFDLLYMQPCNTQGEKLTSEKSFLIYPKTLLPDKFIFLAHFEKGQDIFNIQPPKNYTGPPAVTDKDEQLALVEKYFEGIM